MGPYETRNLGFESSVIPEKTALSEIQLNFSLGLHVRSRDVKIATLRERKRGKSLELDKEGK